MSVDKTSIQTVARGDGTDAHDDQVSDEHVHEQKDEPDHLRPFAQIADESCRLLTSIMVGNGENETTY